MEILDEALCNRMVGFLGPQDPELRLGFVQEEGG
jgi:hypothetical protein